MTLKLILVIAQVCHATGRTDIYSAYKVNNQLEMECQVELIKCVENKSHLQSNAHNLKESIIIRATK